MSKNALKTVVFGRLGSQSGRFGSKNGHLGSKSGRLRFVFGLLGAESGSFEFENGRFEFESGHLERVGSEFCVKRKGSWEKTRRKLNTFSEKFIRKRMHGITKLDSETFGTDSGRVFGLAQFFYGLA